MSQNDWGRHGHTEEPDKNPVIKSIEALHKLSNTFGVAVAGIGLVFIGVFILFLNETTGVVSSQQVEEKLKTISDIQNIFSISQENNNRLVYITGPLKTNQPLTDGQFGITAHAVKLRREVQMFQWVEHSRTAPSTSNQGNDVSTVYTKEWRSELIQSGSFVKPERHQNREEFPVKSITYVATHAFVGSYYLKENLKEKMEEFLPMPLIEPKEGSGIELKDGWYYQDGLADHPDIGEIRARFFYCGASGKDDETLGPAQEEMVTEELGANTSVGWSLRICTFILVLLGLNLANNIMYQVASLIPALQDFFVASPLRFHLLTSVIILFLVASLCWISIKAVFLLFMFVCVFVPFAFVVKVGSSGGKKASSKV